MTNEKREKIYAWSNPSVHNCNNCDYINNCNAIRIGWGKNENALRNYSCFDHSHFDDKK